MDTEIKSKKHNYQFSSNSLGIKALIVFVLIMLLQIPTLKIKTLVEERDGLRQQAINEVSSKWANAQTIKGPILSIPVYIEYQDGDEVKTKREYFHLLPNDLNISGDVQPQKLKLGIYDVVVYESLLKCTGDFLWDDKIYTIDNLKSIDLDNAFLTIGISDLRGLKDQIITQWNGQSFDVESGSKIPGLIASGVTVALPNILHLNSAMSTFAFDLNLQGSRALSFLPLGKSTVTKLSSPWTSPSFKGAFLPDNRDLSDEGFSAEWKVLQLNRNIPQSFLGNLSKKLFTNATYGVELMIPLDDYQKTIRSVKYGILTIALTFLIFFLVEVINKQRIHPFQYGLVGLALCLFYVLLLSISEQTNFNLAYAISTFGIVTMIALYSLSIFNLKKITGILICVLSLIYVFLFVTLQLADYALLMGSVGLTVILALTMYFTRNINWYNENDTPISED